MILALLFTMGVLGAFLIKDSFSEAWILFANSTYRRNNDPGYYIIGIITVGKVIIQCVMIREI